MIYLSKPNLLFLKPKKTAGTSVEIALSCNAGAGDIVTPIVPEDEAVRYQLGGQFPLNWAWNRRLETDYASSFEAYLENGKIKPRWFGLRKGRLYSRSAAKFVNHIPPALILKRAGKTFLENSFVVTMCRHPYETVVSWASHLHADNGGEFEHVLDRAVRHRPLNEVYYFSIRKPDFVIRYESLQTDLRALEERFGLTLVQNLPVTKGKARRDRRPARELLSKEQRDIILWSHKRTFDTFGYEP